MALPREVLLSIRTDATEAKATLDEIEAQVDRIHAKVVDLHNRITKATVTIDRFQGKEAR